MNELIMKVKAFALANKALLIKAGSTAVGAVVGAVVGSIVAANLDEDFDSDESASEEEPSE